MFGNTNRLPSTLSINMVKNKKKVLVSILIVLIMLLSGIFVSSKIAFQKINDEHSIMKELIETQQIMSKNILKPPKEMDGVLTSERFEMINIEWIKDNYEYIGNYLVKLDAYLEKVLQNTNPSEEQLAFTKIIRNTSAEIRFFHMNIDLDKDALKQLYVSWNNSITFENVNEYEKRIFEKITLE